MSMTMGPALYVSNLFYLCIALEILIAFKIKHYCAVQAFSESPVINLIAELV